MTPSQRIVLNTVATYTRSVLGAGLALFSSRWVLNALGQTDFGLFSVVGSIIIFITFLNMILASSAARHYAFSLGQGDPVEVNRWFNAALGIHLILAITLILIGWPMGEYVIAHILTIPSGRINACLWVFRISLVSAFVSMISIPFIAMFTAQQRIAELAVWNLLYSFLTFALAFLLTQISGDRLLFYAIGMVGIIVFVQFVQIFRAAAIFSECRISYRQWFDRSRFKEILSFAGWNLVGSLGTVLRNQGSAILLNLYFGPKVNSAYSIANQVSVQTDQFAAAMRGAFAPEITASEGRGDRSRMLYLAQRVNKFGFILVMLFAVPVMIEMDYILKLWLGQPPEYTSILCRLILAASLLDRLTLGYLIAIQAFGKIAAYQATEGITMLLTLPLAWVFLAMGFSPASIGVVFIITIVAISFGKVFWAKKLFGVPYLEWIKTVVLPCAMVCGLAVLSGITVYLIMPPSFARLIYVLICCFIVSIISVWLISFDTREREYFTHNMRSVLNKMGVLANE